MRVYLRVRKRNVYISCGHIENTPQASSDDHTIGYHVLNRETRNLRRSAWGVHRYASSVLSRRHLHSQFTYSSRNVRVTAEVGRLLHTHELLQAGKYLQGIARR